MLRKINPTTPGVRHKIVIKNKVNSLINKNLSINKKKTGGRNITGQITVRHIGGGHKQRIKLIDFNYSKGAYTTSKLVDFIYDSNRNNYLSLYQKKNNDFFLRLAIEGQKQGDLLIGKYQPNQKELINGNTYFLKDIPVGSKISNLIINKLTGIKFVRAAGTFATIVKHENNNTTIKLPSKKIISISSELECTLGSNANANYHNRVLGKAGVKRWLGIKPTVRGEAMNPIDHPHGGKTSGGVRLKTVYGKLAKFVKTHN